MSSDFGADGQTVNRQAASSGGQGGIFGNASASIGDIGLGNSEAYTGDLGIDTGKNFTFRAPVVNQSNNGQLFAIGAILIFGFVIAKKAKVI